MGIGDIMILAGSCLGSVIALAKTIESSLKKTITLETESIRTTLMLHTDQLKAIREQTTKTNGRVNKHDERLLAIDKSISATDQILKQKSK